MVDPLITVAGLIPLTRIFGDKEIASSAEFRKCLYDYDVEKAAMSYLSKV